MSDDFKSRLESAIKRGEKRADRAQELQDAGFEVLQASEMTINIAGSAKTFEEAFGAPIVAEERPVIKDRGREDTATFIECHNSERPGLISVVGSKFEDLLEGVAIEEPRYFMAASSFMETASPPASSEG